MCHGITDPSRMGEATTASTSSSSSTIVLLSSVVVVVVVIVSYRIPQSYLAARLLRFAFVSIPFRSWLCPQNIYATKV